MVLMCHGTEDGAQAVPVLSRTRSASSCGGGGGAGKKRRLTSTSSPMTGLTHEEDPDEHRPMEQTSTSPAGGICGTVVRPSQEGGIVSLMALYDGLVCPSWCCCLQVLFSSRL